jgi:hypothetical protein
VDNGAIMISFFSVRNALVLLRLRRMGTSPSTDSIFLTSGEFEGSFPAGVEERQLVFLLF